MPYNENKIGNILGFVPTFIIKKFIWHSLEVCPCHSTSRTNKIKIPITAFSFFFLNNNFPVHIKKIDLLILSHEDEDHWNGLPSLIERFRIESVYSQQHLFASERGQKILSLLGKKHIPAAAVSYGEVLNGFEPAMVKILNPLPLFSEATTSNDNSCVLRIEYLGHSILLCADIQEQGIASIVSKSPETRSDILQVPHHGSFISNQETLLDAVQPTYAFINSSESIISYKTLDNLEKRRIVTLQTHREGAITFILGKNGITYSAFTMIDRSIPISP